ncbi:very short patch repair endonuclease [Ornithinimicrobium sp. W1665]|uniref:very short patch repair endonuclease n=1 Tax=Ornithinimicrobium sp. W1665 TaxID=3416666 RepID=UPI003D6A1E88
MSTARRRDTSPEFAQRRALHAAGRRFRVVYPVRGNRRRTIHIAFSRARVAIFVDGRFWHGCPEHGNSRRRTMTGGRPRSTRPRVVATPSPPRGVGWRVVRVREHEGCSDGCAASRRPSRPPARY